MPSGVYVRTQEYRDLMSRVMTPIMRSEDIREKIRKSSIGIRHKVSKSRKDWTKHFHQTLKVAK